MKIKNLEVGMIVKRNKFRNQSNQRYQICVTSVENDGTFSGTVVDIKSENCDYQIGDQEDNFSPKYFKPI